MGNKENEKVSILSFAGKYKVLTILGCVLSGVSAIFSLIPFICIWFVVRDVFNAMPNLNQMNDVTKYGWIAVGFSVMSIIINLAGLMCTHIAAFRTARNMRSMALHHLVKLPMGYFTTQGSGKLRRIIDESSGQTETYLAHQLPDLVGAFVTPIALLVVLFVFDWRLGLISLVPLALSFFFMMEMMGPKLGTVMAEYQNALEDMNNEAVEYVRGIPVVKTFQQTVFSFKNFHDAIMRYKKFVINYTISCRLPNTKFNVAINGVLALLIPAGILLIGSVVDYKQFLLNFLFYVVFTPICGVTMTKIMFTGENVMIAQDATKRIMSILNQKILEEPVKPKKPNSSEIVFNHVSFAYPESKVPAVSDVSFKIKPGETVALVGPSGGGKTTVASLIPRFFDITSGSIKIGGVDVREISSGELMKQVAFVFQDTHLFKASLLDNIKMAREGATREEVLRAVKVAQCQDIIDKMPEGIDTIVGAKGIYLSGGEMQRIALARAILKDAPIILLDEATAFADPENEFMIQKAFEELTRGKTVLMIAHRLSTVQNADCIMVLKDGSIAEEGKHDELLKQNGIYAQMWEDYQTSIDWKVSQREVC